MAEEKEDEEEQPLFSEGKFSPPWLIFIGILLAVELKRITKEFVKGL